MSEAYDDSDGQDNEFEQYDWLKAIIVGLSVGLAGVGFFGAYSRAADTGLAEGTALKIGIMVAALPLIGGCAAWLIAKAKRLI